MFVDVLLLCVLLSPCILNGVVDDEFPLLREALEKVIHTRVRIR